MTRTPRLFAGLFAVLAATGCPATAVTPPLAGPTQLSAKAGPIDGGALLAASVKEATLEGAHGLVVVGARLLREGEVIGGFVALPQEACLLGLARPGASVRDVDLFVYNDAGERIAADESPDSRASILVCPPHPQRMYLAARLVGGEGMLALGAMQLPKDRAVALARRIEVRQPGGDSGKLDSWPGLERKIRQRHQHVGGSWQEQRRATLALHPDAPSVLSASVPARRCLDVMVIPNDAVQTIDVRVVDAQGRIIARGRPPGRDRNVIVCSQSQRRISVMVRPRTASGLAAVIISQSAEGAATELSRKYWVDSASASLPLSEAVSQHQKNTRRLRLDEARKLGEAKLALGTPRAFDIGVKAGCSRIDAVAGAPLGPLRASLWNRRAKALGEARGVTRATLFHCGAEAALRVELLATHHGGPVALFVRHDAKPPAALLKQPLAAARLLRRLESELGPVDPKDAAAVTIVQLSAGARQRRTFSLAARRCERIIVASEAASAALQLQLRVGGGALERVRGVAVVSARVCASAVAAQVTLEISASQPLSALLLRRPLTKDD